METTWPKSVQHLRCTMAATLVVEAWNLLPDERKNDELGKRVHEMYVLTKIL